jgi:nicotinamidase/pyrazinamidase
MNTLIIIDVQKDFMPGGALAVPHGDTIVTVINKLQDYFDVVIATQDWHPKNHKSFASNHAEKKPFDRMILHGMHQTLWPDHCVQGTVGAEFYSDLITDKFSAIFRKGMDPEIDSYSGFYDNNHQLSTGLAGCLRDKGAVDLFFCGLAADICVYYTILDSILEGFSATLIEDASCPLYPDKIDDVKCELAKLGAHIINSNELVKSATL